MRLHCPKCAGEISAENVNVQSLVAKCNQCDNVFPFDRETVSLPVVPIRRDLELFKSDEFETSVKGETLFISWHWRSSYAFVAFLFGFVPIVLSIWFVIAVGLGDRAMTVLVAVVTTFAVGAVAIYWGVAQWINSSTVIVDKSIVRVEHGPLPWPRTPRAATTHLAQLYAGYQYNREGHLVPGYGVYGVTHRFEHVQLIHDLEQVHQAIFIEQQIESFLGMDDHPVSGELKRRM